METLERGKHGINQKQEQQEEDLEMTTKFKRYTYHCPELLPVENTEEWLDDSIYHAAGFDPKDEEVWAGRLISAWAGHPAGSLVVSGLTTAGHSFAIQE